MDDRAQGAVNLGRLFLALLVGAAVVWIVGEVTAPLFEYTSAHSDDPTAAQGSAWLQEGIDFMPALFLFITFFGVVAAAVYSREVLG